MSYSVYFLKCLIVEVLNVWLPGKKYLGGIRSPLLTKCVLKKLPYSLKKRKNCQMRGLPHTVNIKKGISCCFSRSLCSEISTVGLVEKEPKIFYMHQEDEQQRTPRSTDRIRTVPERRHSIGLLLDREGKLFFDRNGDTWQYTSPSRDALAKFRRVENTTSPLAQGPSPVRTRNQAKVKKKALREAGVGVTPESWRRDRNYFASQLWDTPRDKCL